MTRRLMALAVVLALTLVSAAGVPAQDRASEDSDATSLSVEVTISRYQGDELVSSRPYVLGATAGSGESSLRLSTRMMMPSGTEFQGGPRTFSYETIGTDIACFALIRGEGRYQLNVTIAESLVDGEDQTSADMSLVPGAPVFRSFESNNTLVLRDGQSQQYLAAADHISGETIRVDVTLNVLD